MKHFLTDLQNRQMVETKTNNVTTVITIQNWCRYQIDGVKSGDQNGEQKETRTETDKNVKNGNNEKTSSSGEDDEVIFKNEFFTVTKSMVEVWKKSYPKITPFLPELARVSDILREKKNAGEKIRSASAFLHTHLKRVNEKMKEGGFRDMAASQRDYSAIRSGQTQSLAAALEKLVENNHEGS